VHLLIRLGANPKIVSRLMQGIKVKYAHHLNDRYGKSGPVWESPFRSKRITTAAQLVNTIAYIHLNPDATVRSEHSSHSIYAGTAVSRRVDTAIGLRAFGGRAAYVDFFADTERLRTARRTAAARMAQ